MKNAQRIDRHRGDTAKGPVIALIANAIWGTGDLDVQSGVTERMGKAPRANASNDALDDLIACLDEMEYQNCQKRASGDVRHPRRAAAA